MRRRSTRARPTPRRGHSQLGWLWPVLLVLGVGVFANRVLGMGLPGNLPLLTSLVPIVSTPTAGPTATSGPTALPTLTLSRPGETAQATTAPTTVRPATDDNGQPAPPTSAATHAGAPPPAHAAPAQAGAASVKATATSVARAARAQPTPTPGSLVDTSEAAGAAAAADRTAPTVAPTSKAAHASVATATSAARATGAQPTPTPGALVDTSEAAGVAAAADRTAPTAAATARTVTNAPRARAGQAASTSGSTDDASEAAGAAAAADRTAPTAVPTRNDTFQAANVAAASSAGVVALTFDAGADRGYAEDILDLLRDQHVVGTFGVTGKWARANPDLVQRMAVEHHLVINHTYDHRSFTGVSDDLGGLSPDQRRTELESADQIIAPLIGHSTRPWYRLPYGDDDPHAASDVSATGFTQKVGWTVDSLGWKHLAAPDIVTRCLERAAPGAVYIFHVGGDSQDHLALERIIPALRERGFGFTTIDRG